MVDGTYCSLEYLRSARADVLGQAPVRADDLTRALAQAHELASAAHSGKNAAAAAHAERLLYFINISNHFTPPIQPVTSIVWGVLARAKLAAAFCAKPRTPDLLTSNEMVARLQGAVEQLGAFNHPIVQSVTQPGAEAALLVYTKNWVGSTYGFTHQLTALSQHCTGDNKKSVLRNLFDEFDGVPHDDLRKRFFEKVGVHLDPEAALDDPQRNVESFGLTNFRTAVCTLSDPMYALGSFYSIEANFPFECKNLLVGLRKGNRFTEDELTIFRLHAEVDEDHAGEWLEQLHGLDLTPRDRARVVDGAIAQLETRRRMYDAMAV